MTGSGTMALAIVVAEAGGDRLVTALTLAAAAAALGRPVAMLFDGSSVAALARANADAVVDALLASARDLGVRLTACQTGLADLGLAASALVDGIETGGMVGFLAANGDAQLLLA